MADIVVHPRTKALLAAFLAQPTHAVLLSGPAGSGKGTLARQLAAELLQLDQKTLATYPYVRHIGNDATPVITIETIRAMNSFLTRKVPGNGGRIVIIEHADRLTVEAQNALLKTLEEPPTLTTLILTAADSLALLPTVRSRVTPITLSRPAADQLANYFANQGFEMARIDKFQLMSGGLPGLMQAFLTEEGDHPLIQAAATARDIVQQDSFARLAMVEKLAKDREQLLDVLSMLQQMAHVALLQPTSSPKWRRIMQQSYEASAQLIAAGQPKLVLTDLMLRL